MISANNEQRSRFFSNTTLALVILLFGFAALFSWLSWQDAKDEKSRQLATVADLGAKVLDSYFAQLEAGMRSLGKDLNGTRSQSELDHAYALVSQFQASHGELESVILMRADGQLLMTGDTPYSRELPTLGNELSFRNLLAELKKGPAFVIGQAISGHIDNSWVVPTRHGVTDKAGKLTYIISANLPINLVQLYLADSAKLGATSFGLIRDDGYLVSLYPAPDAEKLTQTYGKPATGEMFEYLQANKFPPSGQVEGASEAAPDRALQVMFRLRHYPVTLFAEMPVSEIKALWWRKVRVPYFLLALMLAGIFVVQRRTYLRHQVWSQEQRREALRQNFEHAMLERSSNEIFLFDADTLQINFANDFALENLGYALEDLQKRTFLSLYPEMNAESFITLTAPLRKGEQESIKYQAVQAREDGSTYPVEINLQLLTAEGKNECLAIVNDITALKQAEENIRKFNAPVERRGAGR